MTKYRYFAKVNKEISPYFVEDLYMAEENDPVCQEFLDKGFVEAGDPVEKTDDKSIY